MDYHDLEHLVNPDPPREEHSVFSVSDLTCMVKHMLEDSFPAVWVEGEISNFKAHTSGHLYFSIKDEKSQLSIVMFRPFAQRLRFKPEDGMKVLLQGKVTIFERRGSYQLNATTMEPMGQGALQLAFEQLKKKLDAEGLFKQEFKKPIPEFPQTVGVVTSPTGAAIRDILNVMSRRFKGVRVVINPVRVQGEQAAGEIARAIDEFNSTCPVKPDVLIVGRGGGSIEDLWPFNEEEVARSIFASTIPVVSAVGHEVDWTIADFVADLRSPTPSAAAEQVVPSHEDILDRVESLEFKLGAYMEGLLGNLRMRIERCANHYVFREPLNMIRQFQQQVDDLCERLRIHFNALFVAKRKDLDLLGQKLLMLNPLAVLCRGYSVTRSKKDGRALVDAASIEPGDEIETILHQGTVVSTVGHVVPKQHVKRD